jgi:4-hydroxy-tetrahydrodipicolinate synthase
MQRTAPEILKPIADFFGVDIEERLENPKYWEGLCYAEY